VEARYIGCNTHNIRQHIVEPAILGIFQHVTMMNDMFNDYQLFA
jgi:hypothetical protein